MYSRVVGSILLIVAMSVGGGLLSLPVVTAAGGFLHSTLLLIVIYLVMTTGALFILEVCLWLPEGTNFISMARDTLGHYAKVPIWLCYIMMLYCIICIYISGGTDIINSVWQSMHIKMASWVSSLLFVLIFGSVVWHGIRLIDQTNRMLMSGKIIAYVLLVVILVPAVSIDNLPSGSLSALSGAMMPVIFSFGYAIVIPSLRSYLNSNVKQLRIAVVVGSFIPLLCFIIWNYVVQGTMTQAQLVAISHSGKVVSELNAGLSTIANPWLTTITHIFTTICILTAFLSVSLSLSDFIADGVNRKKVGKDKWLIYALTFLPPLAIILFHPYIYIITMRYAGILVVVVLMLLPTLMVWKGRRNKAFTATAQYRVLGGSVTIVLMALIAIVLLVFAVTHL